MSALAERAGADKASAYSTGLLRNIGTVVLNNYPGAVKYSGESVRPDVHAWERAVHGVSAVEVSATLLDHWHFPAGMVQGVRYHLNPLAADEPAEAARLHLACAMVAQWGCALPGREGGLAVRRKIVRPRRSAGGGSRRGLRGGPGRNSPAAR